MRINIAIDGPSGAGKSTIAKRLAHELGYVHLDTGSMYRTVAYLGLKNGIDLDDENGLVELIKHIDLKMMPSGEIIVDGVAIHDEIRTNEMSMAASKASKHELVRAALVAMQQKIAASKGYILDGRDIGTVVLTDAEVKIYLTASVEDRAKRRLLQNQEKNIESNYEDLLEDIKRRDYQDTHREHSPLKKADDAVVIDSSDLTLEEVVDRILDIIKEKTK